MSYLQGSSGIKAASPISTKAAKTIVDVIKPPGGAKLFECGIGGVVTCGVNKYFFQVAYRKDGSKTSPFTDPQGTFPIVSIPIGSGYAPLVIGAKNSFEVIVKDNEVYHRINGIDISKVVMPENGVITEVNLHIRLEGGGKINLINAESAILIDNGFDAYEIPRVAFVYINNNSLYWSGNEQDRNIPIGAVKIKSGTKNNAGDIMWVVR